MKYGENQVLAKFSFGAYVRNGPGSRGEDHAGTVTRWVSRGESRWSSHEGRHVGRYHADMLTFPARRPSRFLSRFAARYLSRFRADCPRTENTHVENWRV